MRTHRVEGGPQVQALCHVSLIAAAHHTLHIFGVKRLLECLRGQRARGVHVFADIGRASMPGAWTRMHLERRQSWSDN